MALNDNNKRTRIYKLCRTCNLQGKKGNALVICTLCTKHVHSNNSCSSKVNNNSNNNVNNEDNDKYICNICKAKRKSSNITAPTTSIASRRSVQLTTIASRRGSASQVTTPSLASKYSSRRTTGSGEPPTTQNSGSSTCTCSIPAHLDLQHQIDKANGTMNELQIAIANNNTIVNFLKQENQRLAGQIQELLHFYRFSTSTPEAFQNKQDNKISQSSNYTNIVNPNKYNSHNFNNINDSLFNNNSSNLIFKNNNSCKDNFTFNQLSSQSNSNFSNSNFNYNGCNNNSNNNNNNFTLNQNKLKGNSDLNDTIGYTDIYSDSDNRVPLTNEIEHSSEIRSHDADLKERRELFVPGFMPINSDINLRCIAFAILKTINPSLTESDISAIRSFPFKSSHTDRKTTSNCSSFIITLKSIEMVKSVMHAKKSFNYFSTKDINKKYLNTEVATALPDKKILINEVLTSTERTQFQIIKSTAKQLGFQFVWYNSGDFLVRWRDKMKTYSVKTETDLHSITRFITNKYINQLEQPNNLPDVNRNIQDKHTVPNKTN